MLLSDYFKETKIPIWIFAKETGISYQTINRICNREVVPSLNTAMLIERVTGGIVDAWDLLPDDNKKKIRKKEKELSGRVKS